MLASVDFLDSGNSIEMEKLFIKVCRRIWPDIEDTPYNRVKLFISDQAPYMVKSVQAMKKLSPTSMHITCLAHAIQRVAETVRSTHRATDRFIGAFKEILRGSVKRRKEFTAVTGLLCPPKPVITRWERS